MVNYLSESTSESKTSLSPKQMENIRSHMFNQLDAYKNQGFKITTVMCDSDAVLKSIAPDLTREGIKVIIAPPGRQGIPKLDRKIRMIKERCRCITSTLPYEAPSFFIPWIVKFVVSRLNMIRRKESTIHSNESPRESFTGRKTNFKSDVNIGFGDYVQVIDVNQDNSLKERTISCISLLPLSDGSGSVKFYCLKAKTIITRDSWVNVPIPDTVIEHLNHLSNPTRKKGPNRDPTFSWTREQLGDDEPLHDEREVGDDPQPPRSDEVLNCCLCLC
jgi:hypothetical protein